MRAKIFETMSYFKTLIPPKSKFIAFNYDHLDLIQLNGSKNYILKFYCSITIKFFVVAMNVKKMSEQIDLTNDNVNIELIIDELTWAEFFNIKLEYFKKILNAISEIKINRNGIFYSLINVKRERSRNVNTVITVNNLIIYFNEENLNKKNKTNILIPIEVIKLLGEFCQKEYIFFYLINLYKSCHEHYFYLKKNKESSNRFSYTAPLKQLYNLYPRIKQRNITYEEILELDTNNKYIQIQEIAKKMGEIHYEQYLKKINQQSDFGNQYY